MRTTTSDQRSAISGQRRDRLAVQRALNNARVGGGTGFRDGEAYLMTATHKESMCILAS